ncbi:MAG: class II glutamine amidotransferase [Pseudomonadota bacterium]
MCRLVAYLGPPRPLADVIIVPEHSLIAQSQDAHEAKLSVNGDGFGIAWYGERDDPGLFKDTLPAWSDGNLLSLCQQISSPLFLAHVRASTEGETARANCHPFAYKNWSFMHNGQTGAFAKLRRRLEASLPDALYQLRRGSTDSELMFLLLLNAGLAEDPAQACQVMIRQFHDAAASMTTPLFLRQTCVFSDGQSLYCFRYATDNKCPTLYASRQFSPGGLVVASEPLDGKRHHWQEVQTNELVRFDRDSAEAFALLAA